MAKKRIDLRVDLGLLRRLTKWCERQPVPTTRTQVFESLIRKFLDREEASMRYLVRTNQGDVAVVNPTRRSVYSECAEAMAMFLHPTLQFNDLAAEEMVGACDGSAESVEEHCGAIIAINRGELPLSVFDPAALNEQLSRYILRGKLRVPSEISRDEASLNAYTAAADVVVSKAVPGLEWDVELGSDRSNAGFQVVGVGEIDTSLSQKIQREFDRRVAKL